MSAQAALDWLRRHSARLSIDDQELRFEAPAGLMTPELRERLRELKPALVESIRRAASGYVEPPSRMCPACQLSIGWFRSRSGDWRCRFCFEDEARRTDPAGRRSVFLPRRPDTDRRKPATLAYVIDALDLIEDPRPPVDAPPCTEPRGHRWTRAGGGGTCWNCGVSARPRSAYRGSATKPAAPRQLDRLLHLAQLPEIPPDRAADVGDEVARGLSERQAIALIGEVGGLIARARSRFEESA